MDAACLLAVCFLMPFHQAASEAERMSFQEVFYARPVETEIKTISEVVMIYFAQAYGNFLYYFKQLWELLKAN